MAFWFPHGVGPREDYEARVESTDSEKKAKADPGAAITYTTCLQAIPAVVVERNGKYVAVPVRDLTSLERAALEPAQFAPRHQPRAHLGSEPIQKKAS